MPCCYPVKKKKKLPGDVDHRMLLSRMDECSGTLAEGCFLEGSGVRIPIALDISETSRVVNPRAIVVDGPAPAFRPS